METEAEVETNALGLAPDRYRQEQADAALPEEQPEEPAPSITAEEVEAIRQAAWEEGMRDGREAGFAKGLEEGKLEGLQQGHQAGLEQGREEGLAMGREQVELEIARWQAWVDAGPLPLARWTRRWSSSSSPWCSSSPAPSSAMRRKPPPRCCWRPSSRGWPCSCRRAGGHPDVASGGCDPGRGYLWRRGVCQVRHWRLQSEPTLSPGERLLVLATELSSIDLHPLRRIDQLLRNFLRGTTRRHGPVRTRRAAPC